MLLSRHQASMQLQSWHACGVARLQAAPPQPHEPCALSHPSQANIQALRNARNMTASWVINSPASATSGFHHVCCDSLTSPLLCASAAGRLWQLRADKVHCRLPPVPGKYSGFRLLGIRVQGEGKLVTSATWPLTISAAAAPHPCAGTWGPIWLQLHLTPWNQTPQRWKQCQPVYHKTAPSAYPYTYPHTAQASDIAVPCASKLVHDPPALGPDTGHLLHPTLKSSALAWKSSPLNVFTSTSALSPVPGD